MTFGFFLVLYLSDELKLKVETMNDLNNNTYSLITETRSHRNKYSLKDSVSTDVPWYLQDCLVTGPDSGLLRLS